MTKKTVIDKGVTDLMLCLRHETGDDIKHLSAESLRKYNEHCKRTLEMIWDIAQKDEFEVIAIGGSGEQTVYNSISHASESLNIDSFDISECICNRKFRCGGYKFLRRKVY